ncbi:MAG: phosphoglucosamine mutase, partial [Colwellia sp.]|nr:phosphoglucosamine mutase [Colwellia sp.]
ATVIEVGTSPNGTNINDGCGATSMKMISEAVIEHNADLGVALDGDGDRLMMVDHKGYVIDGDEAVYIIACNDLKSGNLQGGVVGTLMSNMGLELALEKLDIPFARSNVGDRYVMEMLREKTWQLGAENSGHIINLNHTSTGDGIIAALNVLTAVCQQEKTLFELRQGMTMLPQILVNVRFAGQTDPINSPSVQASVDRVNAILAGRGRVLLRKSGTEPLIRVMVEGPDHDEVTSLANEIAEAVKLAS